MHRARRLYIVELKSAHLPSHHHKLPQSMSTGATQPCLTCCTCMHRVLLSIADCGAVRTMCRAAETHRLNLEIQLLVLSTAANVLSCSKRNTNALPVLIPRDRATRFANFCIFWAELPKTFCVSPKTAELRL